MSPCQMVPILCRERNGGYGGIHSTGRSGRVLHAVYTLAWPAQTRRQPHSLLLLELADLDSHRQGGRKSLSVPAYT